MIATEMTKVSAMAPNARALKSFMNNVSDEAVYSSKLVDMCMALAKKEGWEHIITESSWADAVENSSDLNDPIKKRRFILLQWLTRNTRGANGNRLVKLNAITNVTKDNDKVKLEQYAKAMLLILREGAMMEEDEEKREELLCHIAAFLVLGGLLTDQLEKDPNYRAQNKYNELLTKCSIEPLASVPGSDIKKLLKAKKQSIQLVLRDFFGGNDCASDFVERLYDFFIALAELKNDREEEYKQIKDLREIFCTRFKHTKHIVAAPTVAAAVSGKNGGASAGRPMQAEDGDDDDASATSLAAAAAAATTATNANGNNPGCSIGQEDFDVSSTPSSFAAVNMARSLTESEKDLTENEKNLIMALMNLACDPSNAAGLPLSEMVACADEVFPGSGFMHRLIDGQHGSVYSAHFQERQQEPDSFPPNARALIDEIWMLSGADRNATEDLLPHLIVAADTYFEGHNLQLWETIAASELLASMKPMLDKFDISATMDDVLQWITQPVSTPDVIVRQSNLPEINQLFIQQLIKDAFSGESNVVSLLNQFDQVEQANDPNRPKGHYCASLVAHLLEHQLQEIFDKYGIDMTVENIRQFAAAQSSRLGMTVSTTTTTTTTTATTATTAAPHQISPTSAVSAPSSFTSTIADKQSSAKTEAVSAETEAVSVVGPMYEYSTAAMMRNEHLYKYLEPQKDATYKSESGKTLPTFSYELREILNNPREIPKGDDQRAEAGYYFDPDTFEIVRFLGNGACAGVFLAEQEGRLVVIKPEYIPDYQVEDFFLRTTQSHAKVQHHPCVIAQFGWFVELTKDGLKKVSKPVVDGEKRILLTSVMEYCPGGDFDKQVKTRRENGTLSVKWLCGVMLKTAEGLCEFKAKDVVHRDLKEENLLMFDGDTPKIADLGLARPSNELRRGRFAEGTKNVGTPGYISKQVPAEVDLSVPPESRQYCCFSFSGTLTLISLIVFGILTFCNRDWKGDTIRKTMSTVSVKF